MIVPANRLLLLVAAVGLPFTVIGVTVPGMAEVALALLALLAAVALLDAALSVGALDGLAVRQNDIARLTQGREGNLEIYFLNDLPRTRRLRFGLPFPREIHSEDETQEVVLPVAAQPLRCLWPVRPLRRGRYALDQCYVETGSPLGLWALRRGLPFAAELRVYPNLMTEKKHMAALLRGGLGLRHQRMVGKGREFEKLRDYVAGDSLADIHWKATAKRSRPITKTFQIERTQEVYFIIDASRLSARPGTTSGSADDDAAPGVITTILDRYLKTALIACMAAERQGDLFGMILFSDKVHMLIPAKNGRAHYGVCRDAIHHLQPRLVTPDFDELLTTIRLRLRRRALLVFLTSLDDPTLAESFQRRLELVCRQHLVLVNMIHPHKAAELFSDETVAGEDEIFERLGGHLLWQDLRRLEKTLARHGVRFNLLSQESMVSEIVKQYLEIKSRQLL